MELNEFKRYVLEETLTKQEVFKFFGIPEQFLPYPVLPYTRVEDGKLQKNPPYKWAKYREEEFNFNRYFSNHSDLNNLNFCVLTENVAELDIDDPIIYEAFKFDKIETLTVKSGSGGYKLYFTCDEMPPRKVKVNNFPIDIITKGNLSVIPPSHNKNGAYEVVKDLPIHHIKNFDELIKRIPLRTEKHLDIKDFKAQLDLVKVVEDHGITLDNIGKIHRGLCPFHSEASPSFTVYDKTDSFYCFGCQSSGDVISFIEKKCGYDFKEAVSYLAETYNLEPPVLGKREKEKKNVIDTVMKILKNHNTELWHDIKRNVYISLDINDVIENRNLRSPITKEDLQDLYRKEKGKVIPDKTLDTILSLLSSEARAGKEYTPFIRVGYDDSDNLFYDLSNKDREVVKISKQGWEITTDCPIKFIRPDGQKPTPTPIRDGSLTEFYELLDLNDVNKAFITAALVSDLSPFGPYPILNFDGPHGSRKSTIQDMLISIVDDKDALSGGVPRNTDDYLTDAASCWIVGLDNIGILTEEMSNVMCRVATKIAVKKRKNYTDGEVYSVTVNRPQKINGIGQVGFRNDYIDRSLFCYLDIPKKRLTIKEVKAKFEELRPKIFGKLLDMVVDGLKNYDKIKNESPEEIRMMDFFLWAKACLPVEFKFEELYKESIRESWRKQIEGNHFAETIIKIASDGGGIYTPKSLLVKAIRIYKGDDKLDVKYISTYDLPKDFPKASKFVIKNLKYIIPALKVLGVDIEIDEGRKLKIDIKPFNGSLWDSEDEEVEEDLAGWGD